MRRSSVTASSFGLVGSSTGQRGGRTRLSRVGLILACFGLIAAGCSSNTSHASSTGTTLAPSGSAPTTAAGTTGSAGSTGSTGSSNCTVKFGISYISDGYAAAQTASGHKPTAAGAAAAVAAIVREFSTGLTYLNSHGGWGGCTVQPVYYQFHILGNDWNQEDQQMCTTFTSDNHVFVALNWDTEDTQLTIQCMSAHKTPMVWDSLSYQLDNADFQKYSGYLYQPWGISLDRWGSFVDALKTTGVLHSGSNIGIVTAEDGTGTETHLMNDVLQPKLQADGYPVTSFTYTNIVGFQGLSDVATSMGAAVLKFKRAGVNTVLLDPSESVSTLEFSVAAASQGYFPEYIGSSLEGVGPASYLTAKEQQNAVMVSWLPGRDVNPPEPASVAASNPPDAARTLCQHIYAGVPSPPYDFCDAMFFVQQALAKAPSGTPTASGLQAGVNALGTSFQSANGYGPTDFGPGKYDGGQEVRIMTYSPQLKALNYADQPVTVP